MHSPIWNKQQTSGEESNPYTNIVQPLYKASLFQISWKSVITRLALTCVIDTHSQRLLPNARIHNQELAKLGQLAT